MRGDCVLSQKETVTVSGDQSYIVLDNMVTEDGEPFEIIISKSDIGEACEAEENNTLLVGARQEGRGGRMEANWPQMGQITESKCTEI